MVRTSRKALLLLEWWPFPSEGPETPPTFCPEHRILQNFRFLFFGVKKFVNTVYLCVFLLFISHFTTVVVVFAIHLEIGHHIVIPFISAIPVAAERKWCCSSLVEWSVQYEPNERQPTESHADADEHSCWLVLLVESWNQSLNFSVDVVNFCSLVRRVFFCFSRCVCACYYLYANCKLLFSESSMYSTSPPYANMMSTATMNQLNNAFSAIMIPNGQQVNVQPQGRPICE